VALISFRASDSDGLRAHRPAVRRNGGAGRGREGRSAEERKIAEVNASIYLVDAPFLFAALRSSAAATRKASTI